MSQQPLGGCSCPGLCGVHDREPAAGRDLSDIGCDEVSSLTGEIRPPESEDHP
jgi:hypothetical protein